MHLHAIQNLGLLKTMESHISHVWVMEFISIISPSLGKVKAFSDNSNLTILVDIQCLHKNNK